MTRPIQPRGRERSAFTLIELLIVMGVIAVLAAMIFPAVKTIKEGATRKKAQAELHHLQLRIESYKAKLGFYPPDNGSNNPAPWHPPPLEVLCPPPQPPEGGS